MKNKFYIDFEANTDGTILTIGVCGTDGYEFNIGIKPVNPIHWSVTKLTGITNEMAANYLTMEEAADRIKNDLLAHIGKAQLIHYGQNDTHYATHTRDLLSKSDPNFKVFNTMRTKLFNKDGEISRVFHPDDPRKVALRDAYATICRDMELTPTMLDATNHDALGDARMLMWVDEKVNSGEFVYHSELDLVMIPKVFKKSLYKIAKEEKALANVPVEDRNRPVWVVKRTSKATKINYFKTLYHAIACFKGPGNQNKVSNMVDHAYSAVKDGTPYMGRLWSFTEITA